MLVNCCPTAAASAGFPANVNVASVFGTVTIPTIFEST